MLLPNSPITRLENVGHYPQWETPGRVLAAMDAAV